MPREIDRQAAAQKRSSRLLIGMAAFIFIGVAVYGVLLFLTSRRTPAHPDTYYAGENGVAVYYESAVWPVCHMTQDPTLGQVLELASSDDPEDDQYQVVLFQRGDPSTYPDFIAKSEEDLRASYGFISPRDITIQVEGAQVEAVRCDIQAYYAVLATITYDSGDVIYVSALTRLASINDVLNLIESVTLA
ncbi:MAG TPA: hypothetical protein H9996_08130 [Candidatus Faecalibacterium avium]|nr:hypothetical protein [Candidatus Faecalibacterium avium]